MTISTTEDSVMPLEDCIKLSFKNKEEIAKNSEASCYHCIFTFDSASIRSWCDKGLTPICPLCDIDAVVPGRRDTDVLTKWNQASF
jgi:hypothetical protein